MTAPDFIAENAYSPPAAPGMLGEEVEKLLCAFAGCTDAGDRAALAVNSRAFTRAILSLIRPAFEAKDQQVRELAQLLDKQMGTPCEQIRHQQEVDDLKAKLAQAVEAMEPFVQAFDGARESYVQRYGKDAEVGLANFNKMPDRWAMDRLTFDMGTFRRARAAASAIRGEK